MSNYPELEDYRKYVPYNQRLHIPKNPKTRYRPPSWHIRPSTAYSSKQKDCELNATTDKADRDYWAMIVAELRGGLHVADKLLRG